MLERNAFQRERIPGTDSFSGSLGITKIFVYYLINKLLNVFPNFLDKIVFFC